MLDLNHQAHQGAHPLESRYQEARHGIPAAGYGAGCNTALLGVANLGVLTGRDPQVLHDEIRQAIPPGGRHVTDAEIARAINKALSDHQGGTFTPRPQPKPIFRDGSATLRRIIEKGTLSDEADIWAASSIHFDCMVGETAALFIQTMFELEDLIFIGDRHQAGILGDTIRTAAEWITFFQAGGKAGPFIIINPLDGIPRPKKDGTGETLRGDANVKAFRRCLIEFDNLSREDQFRFWSAAKLPILSLIDSGGKSIHAWIDVQKLATVSTPEEWQAQIKDRLYSRILIPMGVDRACSNPARLSRLPGYFRDEKGAWQRLLWLSREGRTIC